MIKLEAEDNRRDHVLDIDEKAALLDAALNDSNPRVWLFAMIGLHTSLRHAEILASRFDGLDTARRRLTVRVKGGRLRAQPLTWTITDLLVREREMANDPEGWVFPNPRTRSGHVESMKSAFRRVVVRTGLDPRKVTPHTMRHTAITEMAETGAEARGPSRRSRATRARRWSGATRTPATSGLTRHSIASRKKAQRSNICPTASARVPDTISQELHTRRRRRVGRWRARRDSNPRPQD